ncbi:MAG TPA: hypothetical protein VFG59_00185 [Anaeromyxobacter sp.]|nr:hypothetical protein [Anaeromyxobacter sp.]
MRTIRCLFVVAALCLGTTSPVRAAKPIEVGLSMNQLASLVFESSPLVPDADAAARGGIEYLKLAERIADYEPSDSFPDGHSLR